MTHGKAFLDVFQWGFGYYIGTREELVKHYKLLSQDETNESLTWLSWVIKDKRCLFLIEDTTPDIISHEALHLTNACLKHIGHDLDCDNDEVQCYVLDWVVRQIYLGLNKHYKKKATIEP